MFKQLIFALIFFTATVTAAFGAGQVLPNAVTLDQQGETNFEAGQYDYNTDEVLWDNGTPDGRNGVSCMYWPSYPLDREVVDDFVVPSPGWSVTDGHFSLITYYGAGPEVVTAVKVFFYADNAGTPSTTRFAERTASFSGYLTGGSYFGRPEVAIDATFDAVALTPGTWWVCFQPTMEDNSFWLTTVGSGASIWISYPDYGFPKWTYGYNCFYDYYNVCFSLSGEAGGKDVDLTMTPINPPIVIPPTGGTFQFTATIKNNTSQAQAVKAYIDVILPNGQTYGPVLGPVNLNLKANQTFTKTLKQAVPKSAPAGAYQYCGHIEFSTGTDDDCFDVTKQ